MRKVIRGALVVLLCSTALPATAELCAVDSVPAATLLIPYFEVEASKKGKVNTVVSIQNTDSIATVAHVTLWTDWAVPTLSFDVFLTGYDIQTIDLRKIFFDGELPRTAHAANDPDDTISPHGGDQSDNPDWDSAPDSFSGARFEGCDQLLPPAPLPDALVERIRRGHTGEDTGDGCVAADHGDSLARGYITIDNVTDCSLRFPGEDGYFGADGIASNVNQLRGEFYITEKSGRGVAAGEAVAIEASSSFGGSGVYTFYGRYVDAMGTDRREPLATTWAVRQTDSLPFGKKRRTADTDLLVWRDTTHSGLQTTYQCGVEVPPWFPYNENQIVAFDERSNAMELCGFVQDGMDFTDPTCAPLATQRVRLGQGDWATPVDPGWHYLNFNTLLGAEGAVTFDGLAQSYVAVALSVTRLRGTSRATALTSACDSGNGVRRSRRGRR